MKNITFRFLFGAFVLCLLGISLQSAGSKGPSEKIRAIYRLDTITNTEVDTFGLTKRTSTTANNALASYEPLISLYTLDVSVVRTSISGTPNVKVYLEKSATTTPTATGWLTIDSTTTTSGVGQISISEMRGEIYRFRVKGTGTQSTSYKMDCLLKKLN